MNRGFQSEGPRWQEVGAWENRGPPRRHGSGPSARARHASSLLYYLINSVISKTILFTFHLPHPK